MDKILAKQIIGVVDNTSDQTIEGTKTFSDTVIIQKKNSAFHMLSSDGFIYWVIDAQKLEEDGNYRLGMVNSRLTTQQYMEGNWSEV